MPTHKTIDSLFKKLGYHTDNFFDYYLDNDLAYIQSALYELETLLECQTKDKNDPKIAKIDSLIDMLELNSKYKKITPNRQNIILLKAANAINKRHELQSIRKMLLDALKMSVTNYNVSHIPNYFLTMQDRKILGLIADTYSKENRPKDAVDIMYGIKLNLENHCIDLGELGRLYPQTIYSLAKYLFEDYRYDEALESCDAGLKACKDTRCMYHYPHIAYMKATALGRLGRTIESEELYMKVINALELFDMSDDIDEVREMMKVVLGRST